MEGCHKILILKIAYLLFSPCLKVPQAAGYGGDCGTQLATFVLVLHRLAQHLPGSFGSPKPALTASTQAPRQAQFWHPNTV